MLAAEVSWAAGASKSDMDQHHLDLNCLKFWETAAKVSS